jgi:hypothetical protein
MKKYLITLAVALLWGCGGEVRPPRPGDLVTLRFVPDTVQSAIRIQGRVTSATQDTLELSRTGLAFGTREHRQRWESEVHGGRISLPRSFIESGRRKNPNRRTALIAGPLIGAVGGATLAGLAASRDCRGAYNCWYEEQRVGKIIFAGAVIGGLITWGVARSVFPDWIELTIDL